jgi:membrane-bound metal-dependent hydrolase YbcI (DUF457 family)
MAGYREHISVSGLCGVGYGVLATVLAGFTPVQGALAAVVTWVGGMLPDLDADGGKPVREIFGLLGAVVPMFAIRHLVRWCGSVDGAVLAAVLLYAAIRYGGSTVLKRVSVHRGMFHSIPALVIAAELVFLGYLSESYAVKFLMALGVAIGFLSHLLLDELYSVQLDGLKVRLSKSAGSALKMYGKGLSQNVFAYGLLFFLTWLTLLDLGWVRDPYARLADEQLEPQRPPATRPLRQAAEETPERF